MHEFKIVTFLRRWWILILLFSLIGSLVFYQYISKQQTYTARTLIEYVNEGAVEGKTPTGDNIDVTQIMSSSVIQNAIDDLGIGESVESVRSCMSIEPVIPEDELTRKEALLATGAEYTYFPTRYIICYSVGSSYSIEYVRQMLDAVIDSYLNDYGKRYISLVVIPDDCSAAMSAEYDYLESVELIDNAVSALRNYASARSDAYPDYRSSQTGYTFRGIYLRYNNLYDNYINNLYATVLNNGLAKDYALLREKYQRREIANNQSIAAYDSEIKKMDSLLAAYIGKVPAKSNVIEYHEGAATETQTAYEQLVNENIGYTTKRDSLKIDNEYIDYVTGQLEANAAGNTEENRALLLAEMQTVVSQSSELYSLLKTTMDEFNQYLAIMYIKVKSTTSTATGINLTMYMALAFAFFVIVGVCGGAGIGYLSKLISNVIFYDSVTDLPNRISCDRMIAHQSEQPLGNHTVCTVIQLRNLIKVNHEQGREYGNITLRNLGHILKSCSSGYGQICYNGGVQFIGFFNDCSDSKAEYFRTNVLQTVEKYNQQFPEYPMDVTCTINEAAGRGIFEARDLLRATMGDAQREPARKEEAHDER